MRISRTEGVGTDDLRRLGADFALRRPGLVEAVEDGLIRWHVHVRNTGAAAIAIVSLLIWAPLLLLAGVGPMILHRDFGHTVGLDAGVHIRCLFAIPLLAVFSRSLEYRARITLVRFVDEEMIPKKDSGRFAAAVTQAQSVARSWWLLGALVVAAYLSSLVPVTFIPSNAARHFSVRGNLTPSGWWQLLVTLPVYRFLLYSALVRWAIWGSLLARISRLDLQLIGAHSDRAAGLKFVVITLDSFALLSLGASLVIAATWFRLVAAHVVVPAALATPLIALLLIVFGAGLAPFVFFVPVLRRLRLREDARYARMAEWYFRVFDREYVAARAEERDPDLAKLLAEPIANLGTVCENARSLQPWPVDRPALIRLALSVLAPLLPVIVVTTPPSELLKRVVSAIL